MCRKRIAGSANEGFLELLIHYPLGAGMGSAVGTSIPFFLAHLAPEPIGLENEYSRILVDQGWFGLAGWLALLGWLYVRPPSARPPAPWRLGVVFMYSLTLACWATAFIGTGILTSIPGTFLLLTQMGVLVCVRNQGAVPEAVSPDTETRPISRLRLIRTRSLSKTLGVPDQGRYPPVTQAERDAAWVRFEWDDRA